MARFLIEAPHGADECLKMFHKMVEMARDADKLEFGCKADDHRAIAVMDADSEAQALEMVPESFRHRAHIVKLEDFEP